MEADGPVIFLATIVYEIVFTLCLFLNGVGSDPYCVLASTKLEAEVTKEQCEMIASELDVTDDEGLVTAVINARCLRSVDA